jgi:hypothetical protein
LAADAPTGTEDLPGDVVGRVGDAVTNLVVEETNLAMWEAAESGNFVEMDRLLAEGADPDWQNPKQHNQTALVIALINTRNDLRHHRNRIECIESLIVHGADVEIPAYNETTPLMIAAVDGQYEVIRILLLAGANLEAMDGDGNTALSWAKANPSYERHRLRIGDRVVARQAWLHITQMLGGGEVPRDIGEVERHPFPFVEWHAEDSGKAAEMLAAAYARAPNLLRRRRRPRDSAERNRAAYERALNQDTMQQLDPEGAGRAANCVCEACERIREKWRIHRAEPPDGISLGDIAIIRRGARKHWNRSVWVDGHYSASQITRLISWEDAQITQPMLLPRTGGL